MLDASPTGVSVYDLLHRWAFQTPLPRYRPLRLGGSPGDNVVCIYGLVPDLRQQAAIGGETAAYGLGKFVLTLATAPGEVVALRIGVAGMLQRRKRTLALPGLQRPLFLVAIQDQTGLGRLGAMAIACFTKPAPRSTPYGPETVLSSSGRHLRGRAPQG